MDQASNKPLAGYPLAPLAHGSLHGLRDLAHQPKDFTLSQAIRASEYERKRKPPNAQACFAVPAILGLRCEGREEWVARAVSETFGSQRDENLVQHPPKRACSSYTAAVRSAKTEIPD